MGLRTARLVLDLSIQPHTSAVNLGVRIAFEASCEFPGQIDDLTRRRAVTHYSRVDVE